MSISYYLAWFYWRFYRTRPTPTFTWAPLDFNRNGCFHSPALSGQASYGNTIEVILNKIRTKSMQREALAAERMLYAIFFAILFAHGRDLFGIVSIWIKQAYTPRIITLPSRLLAGAFRASNVCKPDIMLHKKSISGKLWREPIGNKSREIVINHSFVILRRQASMLAQGSIYCR